MKLEKIKGDIYICRTALTKHNCKLMCKMFDDSPNKHIAKEIYKGNTKESTQIVHIDGDEWKIFDKQIAEVVGKLGSEYFKKYDYNCSFHSLYPYKIIRYLPGQSCEYHVDWGLNEANRLLTVLFYLNDVEDGGETVFPHQGVTVKPKAGTCIVFPPYLTHRHYANSPKKHNKYIISTWCLQTIENIPLEMR